MATAAGDGSASASASAADDSKLLEAAIKETMTPSSSDGAGSSDKGVHVQSYELLDTKDNIRCTIPHIGHCSFVAQQSHTVVATDWRVTSSSGAKLFVRTGEGKHELSFKSVVEPYLTSHGCKQVQQNDAVPVPRQPPVSPNLTPSSATLARLALQQRRLCHGCV